MDVKTYRKGYAFERELIRYLESKGFLCIRTAGSGKSRTPDIVAFKKGRIIGIEAKFHEGERLSLTKEQFDNLKLWRSLAGMEVYVAWKRKRKLPMLIPLSLFKISEKTAGISWEDAVSFGILPKDL